MQLVWIPPLVSAVGLGFAWANYVMILRWPDGEGKVREIADAIHLGAMVDPLPPS